MAIERAAIRKPGQCIGVRLVLRLLEPGRIEDDRGRLLAHPPEQPPVLVGEVPGDGVIDRDPADERLLERQRAGEHRCELLAVETAAIGARGRLSAISLHERGAQLSSASVPGPWAYRHT